MKYGQEILSAATACVITAGSVIAVIAVSQSPQALNKTAWMLAVMAGLAAAAKDLRSSFRLPPVTGAAPPQEKGPDAKG